MSSKETVYKEVIVHRKDLKIRKGKFAAQCAHAALQGYISVNKIDSQATRDWLDQGAAKIVLGTPDEESLLALYQKARDAGIPVCLITDAGRTEFHGVATNTCICLGPWDRNKIDKVTGTLQLL